RLLYQLHVSLQRMRRAGLTAAALLGMQQPAPARLHALGTEMYQHQLKGKVARQVEVNLQQLTSTFEQRAREREAGRVMQELKQREAREQTLMEQRKREQAKLHQKRRRQDELMAQLQAATVRLPAPPLNRTLQAITARRHQQQQRIAQQVTNKCKKNLHAIIKYSCHILCTADKPYLTSFYELDVDCLNRVEYVGEIRRRLQEDGQARNQREKRRRAVLVQQLQAQRDMEELDRVEELVGRLMRQSQQEQRVAVQLLLTRQHKETVRQNRLERHYQLAERRHREFLEALDADAARSRWESEEKREQAERERELHAHLLAERMAARHAWHKQMCMGIVLHVVDLATRQAEYRELTGRDIQKQLLREWRELFVLELPVYDPPDPKDTSESTVSMAHKEAQAALDEQDFLDYLGMKGEWQAVDGSSAMEPPPNNAVLGHVVRHICTLVRPPRSLAPPVALPPSSIRACVLGKPFSGKTSCLQRLSQECGLVTLNVSALLLESMETYNHWFNNNNKNQIGSFLRERLSEEDDERIVAEGDDNHEEADPVTHAEVWHRTYVAAGASTLQLPALTKCVTPLSNITSNVVELGRQASEVLAQGGVVPDQLLVFLVLQALRELPEQTGWILDGFPATVQQAKLLEKALTGWDEDLEEGNSKEMGQQGSGTASGKVSLLVQDPFAPPKAPPPPPALDLALVLTLSDSAAFERAESTSCEDLRAHTQHLLANEKVYSRNHDTDNTERKRKLLKCRLVGFEKHWPDLEQWFGPRHGVLQSVCAQTDPDLLYQGMKRIFEQTLLHKQQISKPKGKYELTGNKIWKEELHSEKQGLPGIPPMVDMDQPQDEEIPTMLGEVPSTPTIGSQQKGASPGRSPKGSRRRTSKSPASEDKKERAKSKEKKGKSPPRSGKAKGAGKEQAIPEPIAVETVPPGPTPGSSEWEYVDQPLTLEMATYLGGFWDNMERTYISNCKTVFHNLRREREAIVHHLYDIRQEFVEFLRRPDHKQEFVQRWQIELNELPGYLRGDDDTRAEMHQRAQDLKEKLWDITDGRKEEAEKELLSVMHDGWLNARLAAFANHYITLMQVRHHSHRGAVIPSRPLRAPHLDCPSLCLPRHAPKQPPSLLPNPSCYCYSLARPPSCDLPQPLSTPQPLCCFRIHRSHINITLFCCCSGCLWKVSEELAVLEQNGRDDEQKDGERAASGSRKPTSGKAKGSKNVKKKEPKGSGKKKDGKYKKGTPSPSVPMQVEEENPEVVAEKQRKAKMHQEHACALKHEETCLRQRLDTVKEQALSAIGALRAASAEAYQAMQDSLGQRYRAEMHSIEQLLDVIQGAVESGTYQPELVLQQDSFYLSTEARMYEEPPPPAPPQPSEPLHPHYFTVEQLMSFHRHLLEAAPAGYISTFDFIDFLHDLGSGGTGSECLPAAWLNMSRTQIAAIAHEVQGGVELLDWRRLLVLAAWPWPLPSVTRLLAVLAACRKADPESSGFLSQEQYDQIELWFKDAVPTEDKCDLYDRLGNLKQALFTLLGQGEKIDYKSMLLYLACGEDGQDGFYRALSVAAAAGAAMALPGNPSTPPAQASVIMCTHYPVRELYVAGFSQTEDLDSGPLEFVSLDALLTVLHHAGAIAEDTHRFSHPNETRAHPYLEEHIVQVFRDLGSEDLEPVRFQALIKHPLIEEMINLILKFKL
uniref:Sperm flagellar 2 n=1 Tax=Petromyzon marinus TaxID=7757 RepID=S4RCG7_PETMA